MKGNQDSKVAVAVRPRSASAYENGVPILNPGGPPKEEEERH